MPSNLKNDSGDKGRRTSGARSLDHAKAAMVIVLEECAAVADPAAVKLEWLTARLKARAVISPKGAELTPSAVRIILHRCGRTVRGLRSDVVMRLFDAAKAEVDATQLDEGTLADQRRVNSERRLERHREGLDLAEEDYILPLEEGLSFPQRLEARSAYKRVKTR